MRATSTPPRSRVRASRRRASPTRRWRGTSPTTRLIPSSRTSTVVAQRAGGTRRATTNRSRATPAAAAASPPSVPSRSTAAAHSPTPVAGRAQGQGDRRRSAARHPVDDGDRAARETVRQQLAERAGDGEGPVTGEDDRAGPPPELGQPGPGVGIPGGQGHERHPPGIANTCSIRKRAIGQSLYRSGLRSCPPLGGGGSGADGSEQGKPRPGEGGRPRLARFRGPYGTGRDHRREWGHLGSRGATDRVLSPSSRCFSR